MNFKNFMYENYFIAVTDFNQIVVEHYLATDPVDCLKQCLQKHKVYVNPMVNTAERLIVIAQHNNLMVSLPRKVGINVI